MPHDKEPNPPQKLTAAMLIDVQVVEAFQALVDPSLLAAAAETTLRQQGREAGELTIVIDEDALLRQLNRDYLGIDAPTDVLSFATAESAPGQETLFVTAPEVAAYLGDVIISYPRAAAQAAAVGHAISSELCLLAVHGTLHLLGHDHADERGKARMWAAQDAVLQTLGVIIGRIHEEESR